MKIEIVSKTESAPIYLGQQWSSVNDVLGESPHKEPSGDPNFPKSFSCYYADADVNVLFNAAKEAMVFDFFPAPEIEREIVVAGVTIDYTMDNLIELERRGYRLLNTSDIFKVADLNVNLRINDYPSECGVAYSSDEAEAPHTDLLDFRPISLL